MKLYLRNKVVNASYIHQGKKGQAYLTELNEMVPIDAGLVLEILDTVRIIIGLFSRPKVPSVLLIGEELYHLTFVFYEGFAKAGYQFPGGWLIEVQGKDYREACKVLHERLQEDGFI